MVHKLKILPEYFEAVVAGRKTFEIRKNDRDYKVGDWLELNEWTPEGGYTGASTTRYVSYILYNWENAMHEDYCIMALKLSAPNVVLDFGDNQTLMSAT